MDKIAIFIWLIFVHYIIDWLFQNYYQTMNKSKSWKPLLMHSFIYTLGFLIPFLLFHINLWWLISVFVLHIILDKRNVLVWMMRNIKGMTKDNTPDHLYALIAITLDQVFHLLLLWIIINIK